MCIRVQFGSLEKCFQSNFFINKFLVFFVVKSCQPFHDLMQLLYGSALALYPNNVVRIHRCKCQFLQCARCVQALCSYPDSYLYLTEMTYSLITDSTSFICLFDIVAIFVFGDYFKFDCSVSKAATITLRVPDKLNPYLMPRPIVFTVRIMTFPSSIPRGGPCRSKQSGSRQKVSINNSLYFVWKAKILNHRHLLIGRDEETQSLF